jgi:hypothetical protein
MYFRLGPFLGRQQSIAKLETNPSELQLLVYLCCFITFATRAIPIGIVPILLEHRMLWSSQLQFTLFESTAIIARRSVQYTCFITASLSQRLPSHEHSALLSSGRPPPALD